MLPVFRRSPQSIFSALKYRKLLLNVDILYSSLSFIDWKHRNSSYCEELKLIQLPIERNTRGISVNRVKGHDLESCKPMYVNQKKKKNVHDVLDKTFRRWTNPWIKWRFSVLKHSLALHPRWSNMIKYDNDYHKIGL